MTARAGRSKKRRQRFSFFRALPPWESSSATRVVRAAPATASSMLCICGVNSRRSASFCAKLTIQYRREQRKLADRKLVRDERTGPRPQMGLDHRDGKTHKGIEPKPGGHLQLAITPADRQQLAARRQQQEDAGF